MTMCRTNALFAIPAHSGLSGASTLPLDNEEAAYELPLRWTRRLPKVVLHPTAFASRWPEELEEESCFATYVGEAGREGAYCVTFLGDVAPVYQIPELDLEDPVISCSFLSRITVTARVKVQPGRLSLVMPSVLEEGE